MLRHPQNYYWISDRKELDLNQSRLNSGRNYAQFSEVAGNKSRIGVIVITFSAALVLGMGFAVASRAADLLGEPVQVSFPTSIPQAPPRRVDAPVATDDATPGISSFAPALAIGVGVTGALARRRRAMLTSAA
jgi:hypothetical protein